jgi:predicted transcriptional regulator
MIRNEQEYQSAVKSLQEEKERLDAHVVRLEQQRLNSEEIKNLIDPLMSFYLQYKEEIESYERLKQGQLEELTNLRSLGHMLICLRIARNISQQSLAEKLGVSPSQVSRDERNEYHGMTVDRAAKVLEALGVKIRLTCEMEMEETCAATA